MYQTTVNDTAHFQVNFTKAPAGSDAIQLNGQPFAWDLVRLNDHTFHIIRDNQSFTAEVLAFDGTEKKVSLKINGHLYTVDVKDRFDLLLEKMGISSGTELKVNDVKAPMPGLIVGISVQPGDVVKKGDSLLILEAMKMENNIKAPGDGTVKTVRVIKSDRVEKGQVLVEFA